MVYFGTKEPFEERAEKPIATQGSFTVLLPNSVNAIQLKVNTSVVDPLTSLTAAILA